MNGFHCKLIDIILADSAIVCLMCFVRLDNSRCKKLTLIRLLRQFDIFFL